MPLEKRPFRSLFPLVLPELDPHVVLWIQNQHCRWPLDLEAGTTSEFPQGMSAVGLADRGVGDGRRVD